MEYGSRERGSIPSAPRVAGGVSARATPVGKAAAVHKPAATTAYVEGASSAMSGADPRPTLKLFGPVQQHGSKKGDGRYCFASGVPARRRLLGRRHQQQALKEQDYRGTKNDTTPNDAGSSSAAGASTGRSSSQRKRLNIKELLGVNPADIILPLFSSPQEKINKQQSRTVPQNLSRNTGSSGGVQPLTFSSGQNAISQQEPPRRMHFLRQRSSALSAFLTRLLPFSGDVATCAGETAPDNSDTAQKPPEQQQLNEEPVAALSGAPENPALQATAPPPGIIIRSSAPLVPAFNASDGNEPIWKPIVYESEPIYLLPDGSVSNAGINTQATTNATPLRNETRTIGTLSACAVNTPASCVVKTPCPPSKEEAPPAVAYGFSSAQSLQEKNCLVSPDAVHGSVSGLLLQTPVLLTASNLSDREDSTEQTDPPLTNYQRYLRWKEQQRKRQLLNQQLQNEQHQQQIRQQCMQTIESLLPEMQSGSPYYPSPLYASNVPHALPWEYPVQRQPYYAQPQQLLGMQQEQFRSQQQEQFPSEPQKQPQPLEAQQQPPDSQRPQYEWEPQQFMPEQQPLGSQQHPQILDDQHQSHARDQQRFVFSDYQQHEQFGDQQQTYDALVQDCGTLSGQGPEEAASTSAYQRHHQSVPQHQQTCQENWLKEGYFQGLQQGETAQRALPHLFPDESCQGSGPATLNQQSLSQESLGQFPVGTDTQELHKMMHPCFPVPYMPEGKDFNLEAADNLMPQAQGAKRMPNFFPQPAYVPQPPPFSHAMTPVAGSPFHPGFNYAEGISVHYNYYDAEEWTSKLQATAAQREYSGSTEAGVEQESLRDASGASLSLISDGGEESAAGVGLKPLLTSKRRLPSGQVFAR